MRLYVGVFGMKQLAGSLPCQLLDLVDIDAAAVITLAGIAFRIFVGQAAADRFPDLIRTVISLCDQFKIAALAQFFFFNEFFNLFIQHYRYLFSLAT